MNKTKFVKVIFTEAEWKWLEHHMAELPDDEMVLKVCSALDDATDEEEEE